MKSSNKTNGEEWVSSKEEKNQDSKVSNNSDRYIILNPVLIWNQYSLYLFKILQLWINFLHNSSKVTSLFK